jgi:PHD/YefM family antitoxin component YafN of YafNO toxin-antitoxin module
MTKKILNTLTSTISELKKSPMDVFRKASKENEGVYVLNRKKIVGIILPQEKYESLIKENDCLQDKVVELVAEIRLLNKDVTIFSDLDVRGEKIVNKETLLLEQKGVLDKVRKREKDDSGFTNIDEIDWDKI